MPRIPLGPFAMLCQVQGLAGDFPGAAAAQQGAHVSKIPHPPTPKQPLKPLTPQPCNPMDCGHSTSAPEPKGSAGAGRQEGMLPSGAEARNLPARRKQASGA